MAPTLQSTPIIYFPQQKRNTPPENNQGRSTPNWLNNLKITLCVTANAILDKII